MTKDNKEVASCSMSRDTCPFPWLALDWGARKIGLALSDPRGRVALPEGVWEHDASFFPRLAEFVQVRKIGRLVIGRPRLLSGGETQSTRDSDAFATKCAEATGLPVVRLDEWGTSREAMRALRTGIAKQKTRRSALDDALAARALLEIALERAAREAA